MTVIDWLLESDPAVRWQVMRDLTGAPPHEVAAERARVAIEGLRAQLGSGELYANFEWLARYGEEWYTAHQAAATRASS